MYIGGDKLHFLGNCLCVMLGGMDYKAAKESALYKVENIQAMTKFKKVGNP